jgi:hypothetical protein
MAPTETTTIRVSVQTRDLLNAIAARRGESAGEVVEKLVRAADEQALLADIAASFEKLAGDHEMLAVYRAECREIEGVSPRSN